MKMVPTFISLCALLCVASAGQATKLCTSQSECGWNECCAKRIFIDKAYCVPRRKLHEICIAGDVGSTLYNGLYDMTCPCEGVLKCLREEYTYNGEIHTHGNPRCFPPNYAGSGFNVDSSSYAGNSNGGSRFILGMPSYASNANRVNSGNPNYASSSSYGSAKYY